jgi:hypothetical protein
MSYHDPRGPGPRFEDIQIRVMRIKPWQVWLGGGLALALGIGLALLATSILLIVVPIALLAGLVWRLTGRGPTMASRTPDGVIDAEYRVIEPTRGRDGPRKTGEN